ACEQHPARGLRELGREALLSRDARDEGRIGSGLAQGGRRARSDGGEAWEVAPRTPEELACAERAGDDGPVVPADVHGRRAGRLELDQRAADDLVAERLDAPCERLELLTRACDDHAQPR